MKEIYFVYVTTNLINGKHYIGEHVTKNLNDNYLGSGVYLGKAFKKYGIENFKREILEYCDSKEAAFKLQEKYIIEYNTLRPNGYNISPTGGICVRGGRHGEETKQKLRGPNPKKALPGDKNGMFQKGHKISGNKNGRYGLKLPPEIRKTFGRNQKGENNVFFGKSHSIETINHIKETLKNKPKILCSHCNRLIDYRNYKRWHGENCKQKKGTN